MDLNDIHSIDDFDWRLQNVVGIESIRYGVGPTKKAGGFVSLVGGFNLQGSEIIFNLPNMTATLLESSNKFFIDSNADEYFKFKNFPRINKSRTVWDYDSFINLIQCRIGNVIYAFLALESFMNHSIPDGYTWINEKDKVRDKQFILEQMSIDPKFEKIMGDIYRKNNLNPEILLRFQEIKKLRDRLIHLKPIDTMDKSGLDPSEDTIWKVLLDKDFPNYAIFVKEIITYFFSEIEEEKIPRWFKKIPF